MSPLFVILIDVECGEVKIRLLFEVVYYADNVLFYNKQYGRVACKV